MMKFKDVIDELLAGKRVRRKAWSDSSCIKLSEHGDLSFFVWDEGWPSRLTREDLTADDWEVFQEDAISITRTDIEHAFNYLDSLHDRYGCEINVNWLSGRLYNYLKHRRGLKGK